MAQYGRTWWGTQWLKALDRIDFSNRLPRGKSYANTNKVTAIKINGNIIEAKVAGSRPKPYAVTVIVPPFFSEEKTILFSIIKNDPLILSQLLNRELPHALLELAEKNNLKIFPESWQDIKLNCSCPDWAVPCKHLAAVIYVIANEIDKNPFLVFNLHQVDLFKEMESLKGTMQDLQTEKILSVKNCIATKDTQHECEQLVNLEPPDFSQIENLLPTLPLLFTANPLFYNSDFKPVIQSQYKRQAKYEPTYLALLKKDKPNLLPDSRYFNFSITVDNNADFSFTTEDSEKGIVSVSFADLLVLLAQTESKHLENYAPSFVFLYRTFRFCNLLIERGAVLPRLLAGEKDSYKIQWIPAMLNDSVKKVFSDLMQWYPSGLIKIQTTSAQKKKTAKQKTTLTDSIPEEAVTHLCAFFMNHSAERCYNYASGATATPKHPSDKKITDLFFGNTLTTFNSFTEKEIPNTIQLLLNRFYITKKDFSPVLQIHETEQEDGFDVEVLMQNNTLPMQPLESLFTFLQHDDNSRFAALKDLQLLAHYMPELNQVIASKGKKQLTYTSETFSDVLLKILPAIRLFGIKTLLPKSLQHLLKPQISVSLSAKTSNKKYFSIADLIDFDWKVALGNTFMTPQEFMELSKKSFGLVKIRDQYVMMSEEEIQKIIKKLTAPTSPKAFSLLQAALSGEYEGASVEIDAKLREKIDTILKAESIDLPTGINATLRQYQNRGFSWLYKNAQLGLGSLLADDMGLGKTLQVITTLQKFKDEGLLDTKPALVVAPTTLLSNWKSEIEKFAPGLRAFVFHGTSRKAEFNDTDVIITTYGIARTENEKLAKHGWYALVIDEAQNVKNAETAQTKAVKKIKADIKIAMSGTPVENRLSEYWSIFDFVNPGYLGNTNWFQEEYARPIEINQDKKRLEKFRKITSPFIMRRIKTDKSIITDLPEKIENNQLCNLSKEQTALYNSVTKDLMNEVESAEGMNRRGLVLKLLTVLKQICNHPLQYLKNTDDLKPEHSGKMLLLLQLLETIYENGEKVLIFSQYKEMGNLLRTVIWEHFGKKALQLHGGNTRKERDEMVQAFQNNAINDTFILSLKAGGTGLNLTAGNHVIHYDLWWNPAVEAQATDRAFRIGQKKNVMVHRMITKGTLEEKIDTMLQSKKQLANLTVANGEKWIGELSDKELKSLITLN